MWPGHENNVDPGEVEEVFVGDGDEEEVQILSPIPNKGVNDDDVEVIQKYLIRFISSRQNFFNFFLQRNKFNLKKKV